MLKQSFVHLPGVGPLTEKKLWQMGVLNWDQLRKKAPGLFKQPKATAILERLDQCERALEKKDFYFFSGVLPKDQHWRVLPEIPNVLDRIAYLDIETTGLGFPPSSESTAITFYYQGQVLQAHEHAQKKKLIQTILAEKPILVTFFGQAFDVPFLTQEYGVKFDCVHLDLCFWLKRQGYKGGLKKIQKLFSDIPSRLSMDIDGYDAVRLWKFHQRGVQGALDTLLTYNAEDTIVLEPLFVKAYNHELEVFPNCQVKRLEPRALPELKTHLFPEIYGLLRSGGPKPIQVEDPHAVG